MQVVLYRSLAVVLRVKSNSNGFCITWYFVLFLFAFLCVAPTWVCWMYQFVLTVVYFVCSMCAGCLVQVFKQLYCGLKVIVMGFVLHGTVGNVCKSKV